VLQPPPDKDEDQLVKKVREKLELALKEVR
jgi:hypothetical protein